LWLVCIETISALVREHETSVLELALVAGFNLGSMRNVGDVEE